MIQFPLPTRTKTMAKDYVKIKNTNPFNLKRITPPYPLPLFSFKKEQK